VPKVEAEVAPAVVEAVGSMACEPRLPVDRLRHGPRFPMPRVEFRRRFQRRPPTATAENTVVGTPGHAQAEVEGNDRFGLVGA
jgi:hypothetical protein